MKGLVTEKTGLTGFISEFLKLRPTLHEELIQNGIKTSEQEMVSNGIVAVADISNTSDSFPQKEERNLFYHTFIELFDLVPTRAEEVFNNGIKFLRRSPLGQTSNRQLQTSITPHAPYSVSPDLMRMISQDARDKNSLLSIHNQETESEDELFSNKSGKLYELFKNLGINLEHLPVTGKSSVQSYLNTLPKENKILLVHNTFTAKEDIRFAHNYSKNIYWCFCPNANLYIENQLPDFQIFIDENSKCCVGTDSYASNWSLSILDELKTISKHNPGISLQTLLQWSTINGAEFFGIENQFGSIDKNRKPGLNLIENIDLNTLRLTEKSKAKKLV
jgi:cytosine/adenosine deaminase-related metal-dependent hydrolase